MDTIQLEGYVEKIVFHNDENGYTVFYVSEESTGEEVACTGIMTSISEGQFLKINGRVTVHRQYGEQVSVDSYEEMEPTTAIAIEKYLGSGAIKGIGEALAARIVKKFGKDTFDIIDNTPEKLAEVKGISEKKARDISMQFSEKRQLRKALVYLQKYNIPMNLSVKIYKQYGEKMYDVISKNPYRIADDIRGVGFKTADTIASQIGLDMTSEYRIKSGILYVLNSVLNEGNCYYPFNQFVEKVALMLQVPAELVENSLVQLGFEKEVVLNGEGEEKRVYLTQVYYTEKNCAQMVGALNTSYEINETALQKQIQKTERKLNITLDEIQRHSVIQAVKNGVAIITGGPGTGKTTTINTIIEILKEEGLDVVLAAPTGRAAKRMAEASGYEAQTIHRLLEINANPDEEDALFKFGRNELTPLEADVVIIDEMSMVDIFLFNSLLKAMVPGMRLILVGDENQLPSVGPGSVLKDLIKADFCDVVKLKRIFRQASLSDIIVNAHKINNGEKPVFDNKSKDFFLMRRDNSASIIGVLTKLCTENIPKYVNAKPYDVQVLSPMRKGDLGVDNLNKILQQYMNPPSGRKKEYEFRGVTYRENDKVMQIRNNYKLEWRVKNKRGYTIEEGLGVFNGDLGIIKRINKDMESVTILFDGSKEVEIEFAQMEDITLAYVTTIHKSQGSEYPAVIIPLLSGPRQLFNRNILYTAVTRARKCVVLIGSENIVNRMIDTVDVQKRYSSLDERIKELEDIEDDFWDD
ncbi:MAG: ATP-dependent RecD-like DNA helicase [Lachnospiraceae bacterium]|nr:ATP-dependent RecD-like DNA helicase [Lachnospiraceae bacterium]